jgi:hypothetical protein
MTIHYVKSFINLRFFWDMHEKCGTKKETVIHKKPLLHSQHISIIAFFILLPYVKNWGSSAANRENRNMIG